MIDPTPPIPTAEARVNLNTAEVLVDPPISDVVMRLEDVAVAFSGRTAVRDVTFDVHQGEITALIGPSGSGKTTLLRSLNRMQDTVRTASVTGKIMLGDLDVNAASTDPTLLRSRVGMVFQRPNPFPTMSIYENTVAGLKFNGVQEGPPR
jgi:phosphate transport system ATP-binding protein